MNWQHFQTYNEAPTGAFEAMCNQLFEVWINKKYNTTEKSFVVVNGAGGDGGVESYVTLVNGDELGVQAKWFTEYITSSQFNQIKNSILTAIAVHKNLKKYIVCVPRDLSNAKNGKSGQVVQNTEYSRWKKMIDDIKGIHPDIDIEFWGNHQLRNLLQCSDAEGIRRYYFEKAEITRESIYNSFDMQKNGWLVQRYIPALHNQGTLHKEITRFLGDKDECILLLNELENIEKSYANFIKEATMLCELLMQKERDDINYKALLNLCNAVNDQLKEISILKYNFRYENKLSPWIEYILNFKQLNDIEEWLNQNISGDNRMHFFDVKKTLHTICEINMFKLFSRLKQRNNYCNTLVLGDVGTGKTHGIANEVELQLETNFHIPILIQATQISPRDKWKDIMINALGLSQMWSEEEIWTALESISYRHEVDAASIKLEKQYVRIVPKVIVCIDGIDEVKPYSLWSRKINQTNVIVKNHPRIRFCFTGRPYAFDIDALNNKPEHKVITLSSDGDVPVRTIYDQYMSYYNIDTEGADWLKYSINTPFELKLLCEIYRNQSIGEIDKSDVTLTKLLQLTFDKMDQEFKLMAGFEENKDDNIVKIVLLKIEEIFEKNTRITRTQMKTELRQLDIYHYINEAGTDKIVDFLEKHSYLQSYKKYSTSFFEEPETIYIRGVQPAYDYLRALKMFEKSEYSDKLKIDYTVLKNIGSMQVYSVMVLEHYGKILWFNKSCRDILSSYSLFNIVSFSLVNVRASLASGYENWLLKLMGSNASALMTVVNKIILPLSRVEAHPLGSMLIDKYLQSFSKPALRDAVWSIPSDLSGSGDDIWIKYDDIDYSNETYRLEASDIHNGLPLVWAWGLATVDNSKRTMIRKELTQWAIMQPIEFYKLFQHFANVNDAQIISDIFSIAMAVSYVCRKNHDFLKLISKWIYHNIFQYNKIVQIYNAAIRYYSRAIMECALAEGIISYKQICKCRPPYRINASLLDFAPEATAGSRMNGYHMLDYDLSRYVLCDPLDRMFLGNQKCEGTINKIIRKYAKQYNIPDLTTEQFVLGSAFGYIKSTGWNDDVFYGTPNGGEPGEKLGIDIAIVRKFWPASHGSMSKIMTVTEKYAWCAKMEMLGYLADRLPYYDYIDGDDFVDDYGKLEDYVNPYQELCQKDINQLMKETEWILPEDLTHSINNCSYSEQGIRKWIEESPLPQFDKWINIKEGEIALSSSHFLTNEEQGVTAMMWVSCLLIKKGSLSILAKYLSKGDFLMELNESVDHFAYPDTDCYISPLEVCWYDWKKEYDSNITYRNNVIYRSVAECTCDMQEHGEVHYELPSKIIRRIMGITYGDGYHYFNSDGYEIAHYDNAGERYGDSQHMLLINREMFNTKLLEENLQPIWIIRVIKSETRKVREKYKFYARKDENYLVWENRGGWHNRKLGM